MKNSCYQLTAVLLSLSCDAAQIVRESFDYAPASSLSTQGGGSGWSDVWYQDGASAITGGEGLGYTDSLGNILDQSGRSADTSGTETTRSLRIFSAGLLNDVWISFLYNLPESNSLFEGVSFFRGTTQVFTVSNPSTTTSPSIVLSSNLAGGASDNTGSGAFGQTHLIVLKLTKGGGTGGADRIEAFIDPILAGDPPSPAATVSGANFDFDRVRIAGQDGSQLLVDELRVGETFTDVTPRSTVTDVDSDGDGLTDAQEAVLGLDPDVSDAVLIAGIQAHPDWFDLYTNAAILGLGNGGVILPQSSNNPVNFILEVQQSANPTHWESLETFHRQVELPAGKSFLRVTIGD